MVDFKSKIKAQKAKDRKRAGKRSKTVSGDRVSAAPKSKLPSSKRSADNSAAILKSAANLFKGDGLSYQEDYTIDPNTFQASIDDIFFEGFKKGGRLKNAGKKRVALRGQRSELRGS
jgi:hypothetical protein